MEGIEMRNKQGFTLIELMIVVAIIAIIAAIAIPALVRSRMSANEGAAAGTIRTISTAEASFQAAGLRLGGGNGNVGQYADLATLASPASGPGFIDSLLGGGTKQGYIFVATPVDGEAPTFTATAIPVTSGSTGIKTYFVDETGVIRFMGDGSNADANSPPLS